jgi:hypothetical protein
MLFQRRKMLGLIGTAGALMLSPYVLAQVQSKITVTKDPNCGCCTGWIEHLRKQGFAVEVIETADLQPVKARLGVPPDLAACHTAQIGRYTIEGHVPAEAIRRLLRETPDAIGLAVPGMPIGSPGMEGGTPEVYEVVLVAREQRRSFGRYLGEHELKA